MTSLVKRCHACGHHNPPGAFLCTRCGADISHVVSVRPDPVPEAEPPATSVSDEPAPHEANAATRKCPTCDAVNPAAALVCLTCGEELEPNAAEATPTDATLVLLLRGQEYPVQPGDIIGRQGNVAKEVLSGYRTISRRHLEVRQRDGQWQLLALEGVSNTTQLDGQEMPRGEPMPLTGRHRLQLSSKLSFECEVRMR
ncbi:MAG: zinc ribbon domain-containing protein [Verrucomicrobiota bacterium]